MKEYRTVFVPSTGGSDKKMMKSYTHRVDGDQLAIDVNQICNDLGKDGFSLCSSNSIVSTEYSAKTFSEGILLIFEKDV